LFLYKTLTGLDLDGGTWSSKPSNNGNAKRYSYPSHNVPSSIAAVATLSRAPPAGQQQQQQNNRYQQHHQRQASHQMASLPNNGYPMAIDPNYAGTLAGYATNRRQQLGVQQGQQFASSG
jgi:hypothetical protein